MLYGASHFRREDSLFRCARGRRDLVEPFEPSTAEEGHLRAHDTRALTSNGPTRAEAMVQMAHAPPPPKLKPALKRPPQPESESE